MFKLKKILICSLLALSSLSLKPIETDYFAELPNLLKREEWAQIVTLGEETLANEQKCERCFAIHDQLVSSYFRLGEFDNALRHAHALRVLSEKNGDCVEQINSLYKLSATLRGLANEAKGEARERFFQLGREAIQESLKLCTMLPEENTPLLARVLFNYGALEMEDLHGSLDIATSQLEKAALLFHNEPDYLARTNIRLSKAYLLQKRLNEARELLGSLKKKPLEPRTHMHLLYLEAQLLLEEGCKSLAKDKALQALDLAPQLNAKADAARFEAFLKNLLR